MPTPRKNCRLTLAALRDTVADLTQVQVAAESGLFQGDVSRLERRPTLEAATVHTLRRYVEALGGQLQVVAVIGGRAYELCGADEPPAGAKKRATKGRA